MALQQIAEGFVQRVDAGLRIISIALTNNTPIDGYITITVDVASDGAKTGSMKIMGRAYDGTEETVLTHEETSIYSTADETVEYTDGTATYTFVWDAATDLGVGTAWSYVYVRLTPCDDENWTGNEGTATESEHLIANWNYFNGLTSGEVAVTEPDDVEDDVTFSFTSPKLVRNGNVRFTIDLYNSGSSTPFATLDSDDQDDTENETWTADGTPFANDSLVIGLTAKTITVDSDILDDMSGIDKWIIKAEIKED